ncbi:MAG: TIGR02206 family membrane protein [Oscillospiraceae bacterium]|nr:TIGR02206 family membrane protein [Oscillospiraceae bacterium]
MSSYSQQIIWCAAFIGIAVYLSKQGKDKIKRVFDLLSAFLFVLLAIQLAMVWASGASLLRNALPFHLCSFTAILTIPMLLRRDDRLFQFNFCLGMPGALMALIFPTVGYSPWPVPARMLFIAIHSIIFFSPILMYVCGHRTRRRSAFIVMAIGNVLMVGALAANHLLNTNYMFLSNAPQGTPLEFMARNGKAIYLVWLELCALVVTQVLSLAFAGHTRSDINLAEAVVRMKN